METAGSGRWLRAILVTAVLVVGACGSGPEWVESRNVSAPTPAPSTTTEPSTTTDKPATTTATSTPPSTTSPSTTLPSTTLPSTLPLASGKITPIGHFHQPEGEFVKITDIDDPELECVPGRLGVRANGELIHVYDELGDVYGVRIHHGFFGQLAMVETCEESVLRLLFSTTALPPPNGIPEITVGTLEPDVFWLSDLGWQTDGLFHARATFFDDTGWNDDVVFTAHDGDMRLLADALGERRRLDSGVDFILPRNWEVAEGDPALDIVELVDTTTPAAVSITIFPESVPPPEPLGDETMRYLNSVYVEFWDEIDDGRARTSGTGQQADEYWFSGPEGDRLVRTVDLDDRTVRIVANTPTTAGAPDIFIPNQVLEAVRLFTAVG